MEVNIHLNKLEIKHIPTNTYLGIRKYTVINQ